MERCFVIVLILALIGSVKAQPTDQFSFTHYSTSTGLPSNQVNSVVQDEAGYMWLGTTDGLIRFDGIRYKIFRHRTNDPASIPANAILQVLIDTKKNLWLLTADGHTGIFNTRDFKFRNVRIRSKDDAALKVLPKRLLTDSIGNLLLLASGNELLSWNENEVNFTVEDNIFRTKAKAGAYRQFRRCLG